MSADPRAIAAWMNENDESLPGIFGPSGAAEILRAAQNACPGMAVDRCPKCRRWDVESHCIDGGLDGERWGCGERPLVLLGQGDHEYPLQWRAAR